MEEKDVFLIVYNYQVGNCPAKFVTGYTPLFCFYVNQNIVSYEQVTQN